MSRIGKQPILLPADVEATINGLRVVIRGPKGQLEMSVHPHVRVAVAEGTSGRELIVTVADLDSKLNRSLWGTTRTVIANMVEGVVRGFSKQLEINGVGYKVALSGSGLKLDVGFSHAIEFMLPTGITAIVEKNLITIAGIDKHLVGQTAAEIRALRKPEPYKGKGIKYVDEVIRSKAGKAAKSA